MEDCPKPCRRTFLEAVGVPDRNIEHVFRDAIGMLTETATVPPGTSVGRKSRECY